MTTPAPTTPPPRERTGACLCGGIKYKLTMESVYDTFCHCIPCQKWTGSVAFAAAICPKEVRYLLQYLDMKGHIHGRKEERRRREDPTDHYLPRYPIEEPTQPNHHPSK
jgi:hypothetical protein